jgi:hypothetical protein
VERLRGGCEDGTSRLEPICRAEVPEQLAPYQNLFFGSVTPLFSMAKKPVSTCPDPKSAVFGLDERRERKR